MSTNNTRITILTSRTSSKSSQGELVAQGQVNIMSMIKQLQVYITILKKQLVT